MLLISFTSGFFKKKLARETNRLLLIKLIVNGFDVCLIIHEKY